MPGPRTPAAVAGFDRSAATYERGRPEYPDAAVAYLEEGLGVGGGGLVVELGAGTGKLTRRLRPSATRLLAVEPTRGMRIVFHETLPDLPIVAATAEAIPVRDGAAAAVVVAQAFHWFRQPEALEEIRRVLVPRGGLGLLWNVRDERPPWMASLGRLIDRESGGVPKSREGAWRRAFDLVDGFGPVQERSFPHVQRTDVAGVVDRVLSISAIGLLDDRRKAEVAGEVERLLGEAPETRGRAVVEIPYRTDVFLVHRS